jgi:hypothetical protein
MGKQSAIEKKLYQLEMDYGVSCTGIAFYDMNIEEVT